MNENLKSWLSSFDSVVVIPKREYYPENLIFFGSKEVFPPKRIYWCEVIFVIVKIFAYVSMGWKEIYGYQNLNEFIFIRLIQYFINIFLVDTFHGKKKDSLIFLLCTSLFYGSLTTFISALCIDSDMLTQLKNDLIECFHRNHFSITGDGHTRCLLERFVHMFL